MAKCNTILIQAKGIFFSNKGIVDLPSTYLSGHRLSACFGTKIKHQARTCELFPERNIWFL